MTVHKSRFLWSLVVASSTVLAVLGALPSQALAQPAAAAAQIERGGKVYRNWCAECHNERGFVTFTFQQRYQGAIPAVLDQRRDLTREVVGYFVRNGVSYMPFFRKTEITDAQLDDLSAYLTSDPEQRKKAK